MTTKSRREAFTLVELLVVITIIGMLMAMILPAVSAVKEQARQVTCTNNQIEIVKAMLTFETRKQRFPGFSEKYKTANGDVLVFAWPISILTELQRNDLYTAFTSEDRDRRNDARGIHVEMFICPSAQKDGSFDSLSYVVNAGREDNDDNQGKERDIKANGVFHDRGANVRNPVNVSTSTLTRADGIANTLMLSEYLEANRWAILEEGDNARIREEDVSFRWVPENPVPKDRINGVFRGEKVGSPSSNHPGGVVAAFCNGTAKYIRDDIDYVVHWQLMTPDGRNATLQSGRQVREELWRYLLEEKDY